MLNLEQGEVDLMWKHAEFSLPQYVIDFMNKELLKPGEAFVSMRQGGMIDLYYFDRLR